MANTFYSYSVYIEPSSNAAISILKDNLDSFYQKQIITNKPEIVLIDNQITITFDDDYNFYIYLSDEEHVNEEATEIANDQDVDWNENIFDKEKLKTCKKRFEVWGDDDFDIDYFNDSLFIIEQIENFNNIIIFQNE